MIRPATLSDLPRLFELILKMHAGSKYAEREIDVDPVVAKSILRDGVMRNGGLHDGSTLLNVIERDGLIEGFMLGLLQRVYSIGNRLEAVDFWLYCTPHCPKVGLNKLVDAYIAWADDNPKVAEIALSWTDAMKVDGTKLGRFYYRKSFRCSGEIWKRASQ